MKKILILLCASLMPLLTGCDQSAQTQVENTVAPVEGAARSQPTPDDMRESIHTRLEEWMGRWNGPEGTYLILEKSGEGYAVRIKDLDSEQRYLGVAQSQAMAINFTRNGRQESLTLVPGYSSGMKWLQDKPYCLMVKEGEAFCRDTL